MNTVKYIPALRYKCLTPLYDFFINLTMPEKVIKQTLMATADVSATANLLDFGCGTATLTIMVKQICPEITVTGIDVDEEILEKATKKIKEENLDIKLLNYDGVKLPFQNNTFDIVISSLVFHHLDTETKQKALSDIFRILNNNGQFIVADFGRSTSWLQRILFNIVRSLDGFTQTDANAKGLLPELISDVGFENVGIKKRFKTMFGEVQIIIARKIK